MENTGKKQFRKKKAKRLLIRSKSVKIPESFNNQKVNTEKFVQEKKMRKYADEMINLQACIKFLNLNKMAKCKHFKDKSRFALKRVKRDLNKKLRRFD